MKLESEALVLNVGTPLSPTCHFGFARLPLDSQPRHTLTRSEIFCAFLVVERHELWGDGWCLMHRCNHHMWFVGDCMQSMLILALKWTGSLLGFIYRYMSIPILCCKHSRQKFNFHLLQSAVSKQTRGIYDAWFFENIYYCKIHLDHFYVSYTS